MTIKTEQDVDFQITDISTNKPKHPAKTRSDFIYPLLSHNVGSYIYF